MKESKESLDKSSHPTELDIDDGWGDFSPSLESIDLVGSFDIEDISDSPLSSLEAAAEESALTNEDYNQDDLPEVDEHISLPPSKKLAENQHEVRTISCGRDPFHDDDGLSCQ